MSLRYGARCLLWGCWLLPSLVRAALPAEALERLKAATAYIVVTGQQPGSGSGFLVEQHRTADGEYCGQVVTNAHVVADMPGFDAVHGRAEVVFRPGTPGEVTCRATLLAFSEEFDLAVLEVRAAAELPPVLSLAEPVVPMETTAVYVFGYPFGKLLATAGKRPEVSVTEGIVSAVRRDGAGAVQAVQIDGSINPGNSGGPVVNGSGQVVGVVVAKIEQTQIGFAIPLWQLDLILSGYADISAHRSVEADGARWCEVVAELLDPRGQIQEVELVALPNDQARQKQAPGGRSWLPIGNEPQRAPLRALGKRQVTGRVRLPDGTGARVLVLQVHGRRKDGSEFWSKPPLVESISAGSPAATLPGALPLELKAKTDVGVHTVGYASPVPPRVDPATGNLLLAVPARASNPVYIVQPTDWKILAQIECSSPVRGLEVSSAGFVTLHARAAPWPVSLSVWDPKTLQLAREIPCPGASAVVCTAASPYALVLQSDMVLQVIDLRTGDTTTDLESAEMDRLAGLSLVQADVPERRVERFIEVAFAPSGETVFVADPARLHGFRLQNGGLVWQSSSPALCAAPQPAYQRWRTLGLTAWSDKVALVLHVGEKGVAYGKEGQVRGPVSPQTQAYYYEFAAADLAEPTLILALQGEARAVQRMPTGLLTGGGALLDPDTGRCTLTYPAAGSVIVRLPGDRYTLFWDRGTSLILDRQGGVDQTPQARSTPVGGTPVCVDDLVITPILIPTVDPARERDRAEATPASRLAAYPARRNERQCAWGWAPDAALLYAVRNGSSLCRVRLSDLVLDRQADFPDPIVHVTCGTDYVTVVCRAANRQHVLHSLDAATWDQRRSLPLDGGTPGRSLPTSRSGRFVLLNPGLASAAVEALPFSVVDLQRLRVLTGPALPAGARANAPTSYSLPSPATFLEEDKLVVGNQVLRIKDDGLELVQRSAVFPSVKAEEPLAVSPDGQYVVWWGDDASRRIGEWLRPTQTRGPPSERSGLIVTRTVFATAGLAGAQLADCTVEAAGFDGVAKAVFVVGWQKAGAGKGTRCLLLLNRRLEIVARSALPIEGMVLSLFADPRGYLFFLQTSDGVYRIQRGSGALTSAVAAPANVTAEAPAPRKP